MTRLISLAFIALVAIAIALMPEASTAKLAALQSHELLSLKVSEDSEETLAELVLRGPAVSTDPNDPTTRTLSLATVVEAKAFNGSVDMLAHPEVLKRSMIRGLREAAGGQGLDLNIGTALEPTDSFANFQLTDFPDGVELTYWVNNQPPEETVVVQQEWRAPSWLSLLPPFIAILLAILFRQPILALFLGVYGGTFVLHHSVGEGIGTSIFAGLNDFRLIFWAEAKDEDRLLIVGFVVFMLSMVGILTRAGGIRGLMDTIAKFANSVRSTLIAAYGMGMAIFFDDYANTILVGSTMRPLTDKFRISREKLAYIVDSTAAPVAGLSIFSTWVAYQVSMYSAQLPAAGMKSSEGYAVLIDTLPYRFYCIFALILVGTLVATGRDFGPMRKAEERARKTGELVRKGGKAMVGETGTSMEPAPGVTPRAMVAIIPLVAFIGVTIGIIFVGGGMAEVWSEGRFFSIAGISQILSDGSGNHTLFWGSLTGLVLACGFAVAAGIAREIPIAAWKTLRSMLVAFVILYLAWMMGRVCESLGTATYLSVLLSDQLLPEALPSVLFLLAAVVAFSTGSSWSTMAILVPLVVGLAFTLGEATEAGGYVLMLMSIGAVLEGAIFGDHCSPISDTTVLSSIACASDHIDHVRTQAPYALVAMGVALGAGYFPCALWGLSPWIALGIGAVTLVILVRWFGKHVEDAPPQTA